MIKLHASIAFRIIAVKKCICFLQRNSLKDFTDVKLLPQLNMEYSFSLQMANKLLVLFVAVLLQVCVESIRHNKLRARSKIYL